MSLDGVLLVDKPRGMTSFDVIRRIRRRERTQKIGHAGTLDPDASGLLVLCLGKATKLAGALTAHDKVYEVDFTLGTRTDTFDSTGETLATSTAVVDEASLRAAMPAFTGPIRQTVPVYSAVKVAGRKLYEYARRGIEVAPPTKDVTIFTLELLSYAYPHGRLRVACSKGTYVRSLVNDLGDKLGVGGVTTHIRRLQSGVFHVQDAVELEALLAPENFAEAARRKLLALETLQAIENK